MMEDIIKETIRNTVTNKDGFSPVEEWSKEAKQTDKEKKHD